MPAKRIVFLALAVLGLFVIDFVGGYLAGKGSTPSVVKTTDRVEETKKVAENTKAATEEKKDQKKDVAKNVERTKTTTKRPDGTVVVEEHSRDLSKTETARVETKIQIVEKEKLVEVVKVEVHEKLVVNRPGWMFGASAGVSVPALLGRSVPSYLPSIPSAAVLAVSVEKRLLGSLYAGVWANTQGVIGASARIGF